MMMSRTIWRRGLNIPSLCRWWLLGWLIIRRLRWIGSLGLVSRQRVGAVRRACSFVILETETSHLSLDIFKHVPALDVPGHYKVTALLLYISDYSLLHKETSCYYKTTIVSNSTVHTQTQNTRNDSKEKQKKKNWYDKTTVQ